MDPVMRELNMRNLSKYLDGDIYVEIYKKSSDTENLIEEGEIDELRSKGVFDDADWALLPIGPNSIVSDDGMLVIVLQ